MSGFSDISVWRQTTHSKFRQQAFIMFHGTDRDAASSIVREQRFRISTGSGTMLGNGVYVSASRTKAQAYGEVIFKLLVYPGDVCRVDRQGHPWQKRWQKYYDSAWVPRNCGMVPSGLEVIQLKYIQWNGIEFMGVFCFMYWATFLELIWSRNKIVSFVKIWKWSIKS